MSMAPTYDTLVVGGGIVGLSLAWGLVRAGERVCLLDQGDDAYRAARGNFGLVWVQGKGAGSMAYARWTLAAARRWPGFAAELNETTGIDVALAQPGGLTICLDDKELEKRVNTLSGLRRELGSPYPFEVLDPRQLKALIPQAGDQVAGAVMSPLDGHLSPLKLLRSLFHAFERGGGQLLAGVTVQKITPRPGGGFETVAGERSVGSARIVLAAGLGNRELAPLVGLEAPVSPLRGQVMVTERVAPFLKHPTLHVRQTDEGVMQIGDSKEEVGFDDGTTLAELSKMAARAARCFPLLESVNVVRTWGSLRVMTPDGLPIYQASTEHPGAFVVTCHSGITLAPLHAGPLVDWMRGGTEPAEIRGFKAERLHVQAH